VAQPTLPPPPSDGSAEGLENMASMLAKAGYDVQYRGKWHLSKDPCGITEIVSQRDLDAYQFHGWEPPEAGGDQSPTGFGGGTTDYDGWYARQAADFLANVKTGSHRPFALFVCLVNPHDVMGYPGVPVADGGVGGWDSESYSGVDPYKGSANYRGLDFDAYPINQIGLPENFPSEEGKPAAQAQSTQFWSDMRVIGPLDTDEQRLEYVRFYAHLHLESDKHFGTILDALEARPHLHRNTLVIRLSDHGEMGLSHGGMRQKAYNAYEETIHVPLVVSNPKLFPGPVQTPVLASLVDLMPTLATIADVPDRAGRTFRGTDLTPVILDAVANPANPTASVQSSVLFTTDENLGSLLTDAEGNPIVRQPNHIRALREERWKVVLTFDPNHAAPSVYELYDLASDPLEQTNLASANPQKLSEMISKLEARMAQTHTTPA
jgi:choline-sulfatase